MSESRAHRLSRMKHIPGDVPLTEESAIEITVSRRIEDLVTGVSVVQTQNLDGSWSEARDFHSRASGVDYEGIEAILKRIESLDGK